jgi:hypothetical protein
MINKLLNRFWPYLDFVDLAVDNYSKDPVIRVMLSRRFRKNSVLLDFDVAPGAHFRWMPVPGARICVRRGLLRVEVKTTAKVKCQWKIGHGHWYKVKVLVGEPLEEKDAMYSG